MTAQGGLGTRLPHPLHRQGRHRFRQEAFCSDARLIIQTLEGISRVLLHCLLSICDDGNCVVRRVHVCVCVSRERPRCRCFFAPGNLSRRMDTWHITIFTVTRFCLPNYYCCAP